MASVHPDYLMSYTNVQIANMALAKIGDEASQITSFTEDSKEANLVNKFYEPSLREVLRMHEWKCAMTRAELAQDTSTPVFGWDYQYSLPADCVRPLQLFRTSSSERFVKEKVEWRVEGRKVLTNYDQVWMLYVKYLTDPNQMDELFIRCLYTQLAIKLAYPLTEDRQLVALLEDEMANVIMPEARRVNSFEGYEIPSVDSEWIEATYTSHSAYTQSYPPFSQTGYGTLPY